MKKVDKIDFKEYENHEDGSVTFKMEIMNTSKKILLDSGHKLLDKKIKAKDLAYQAKFSPDAGFDDLLVAAVLRYLLKEKFKTKEV